MLELAVAGQERVEGVDLQWPNLSEHERRLIRRFRQMSDLERHQVRRLLDQLAKHPEDSES
ncbi:hypothetical protein [Pseudomonas sp. Irchel 3E13]|uniref:hypothetical protein n=1 Tax=Pseudomonas sp. Irchel 3E13 TaxID=2008975 RepID=UPI000BA3151F|nr:hypothetical protein [Pseudomonas sp. Irchel 3E13]